MSDTSYGADLSKRGVPGRLLPEQRDAHARLASLPRTVNDASARAERERLAAWLDQHERAQRTRIQRAVSFKHTTAEFGQR